MVEQRSPKPSGMGSSPISPAKMRSSSMVERLPVKQTVEGSSPSSSAFNKEHWRSLEFSLPCHGRDRGFKSLMLRLCNQEDV